MSLRKDTQTKDPSAKKLLPDESYGVPINGYNDAALLKKRFLKDAHALLRETGKCLAARGLSEMELCKNSGGMAVSGDVFAKFWHPDNPILRVYVSIDTVSIVFARNDGIAFVARQESYKATERREKIIYQRCRMGTNQWLSPNMDASQLAACLLKIYDPDTTPNVVSAHLSAGEIIDFPSPFIHNDQEGVRAGFAHAFMVAAVKDDQKAVAQLALF